MLQWPEKSGHCVLHALFNNDKFVLARTGPDFFSVFEARAPFRFGARVFEVVVVIHKTLFAQIFGQLAARQGLCLHAGIHTGLIKGQGVKRSKHA